MYVYTVHVNYSSIIDQLFILKTKKYTRKGKLVCPIVGRLTNHPQTDVMKGYKKRI